MNEATRKRIDRVKPSSSTVASAGGGAASILLVYVIEQFTPAALPAHVVGAITVLVTIAAGWFFPGGRSVDTK